MTRQLVIALLLAMLCVGNASAQAVDPTPLQFSNRVEEQRFHALAAELRCVKCQNQSLADSNASIAHDLRREVLALMREGRGDEEIKEYLVARYGDFVLYKPRVERSTWLLWFGPVLLLVAGAAGIAMIVRKRSRGATERIHAEEGQDW